MHKFSKYVLLFSMALILLLCISSVSAADDNPLSAVEDNSIAVEGVEDSVSIMENDENSRGFDSFAPSLDEDIVEDDNSIVAYSDSSSDQIKPYLHPPLTPALP